MEIPLLFLDDVGDPQRRNGTGMKAETEDKTSILWKIIDRRHSDLKPMLWTSNLKYEQLVEQWGKRLTDRLWEATGIVAVAGVDLRL